MVGEIIEDNTPKFEKGGGINIKMSKSFLNKKSITELHNLLDSLETARVSLIKLQSWAMVKGYSVTESRFSDTKDKMNEATMSLRDYLFAVDKPYDVKTGSFDKLGNYEKETAYEEASNIMISVLNSGNSLQGVAEKSGDYITSAVAQQFIKKIIPCYIKFKELKHK